MPAAVVGEIHRFITNRILMAKLQRYLLEDVIHLSVTPGEKRFAAGHACKFVKNALTFHPHRAASVAATQYADAVECHIRLLQQPAQLAECVTRIVVLSVTNQQQGAFGMSAALNFFRAQIAGIVQRRIVSGLYKGELIKDLISIASLVE